MAMDFAKLKELARRMGGILVMDKNEPEFVIMSYESFEKMEDRGPQDMPQRQIQEDEQMIDALNKEILALKEEIRHKEGAEIHES